MSKSIGIIKHSRKNLPESVLSTLNFSLVHPYFEYCNIVWGIYRSAVFNSLFLLQKKAICVITNSKWNTSTAALFHKLHILPLYQLNDYQVGCFMYLCMNALLSNDFCHTFVKNSDFHSYATRNRDTVHITTCRLKRT